MPESYYTATADALVDRIMACDHEAVLALNSPWGLYKLDGYDQSGLDVTLFMADWAMHVAQARIRKAREEDTDAE